MTTKREKSELKKFHGTKAKISLIKTRNAIKKKFRELHNQKLAFSGRVQEEYQPIIEPLKSLVAESKKKQQTDESKWQHDQLKNIKNEKLMWGATGSNSSVFKTALPMHRRKLVMPSSAVADTASTSTHRALDKHNLSGFSQLQWNDNENGDESVSEETQNQAKHAEDLIAGQDSDTVEQNLVREIRVANSPLVSSVYGLRTHNGSLQMGNDKVTVQDDKKAGHYKYCVRTKKFTVTPGLTSLLIEENPKYYTDTDLKAYKDMLSYTNAHKKNFTERGAIQRDSKSTKYNKIIKQIFPDRRNRTPVHGKGAGMLLKKEKKPQMDYKIAMKNTKINYTYWDDPNELVDRLRLLLASTSAGHTGHNNEIISIIEELREAKIVT